MVVWKRLQTPAFRAPCRGLPDRFGTERLRTPAVSREIGDPATGENATDKGIEGTKQGLVSGRQGIPLALERTGADVHVSARFEAMLEAIPQIRSGRRGGRRFHFEKPHVGKGCWCPRCWESCGSGPSGTE